MVDLLIKEYEIPFRIAYTIIGNLVKDFTQQNNKKPSQITAEILAKYVEKIVSQKLLVPEEKIKKAIDPIETIKRALIELNIEAKVWRKNHSKTSTSTWVIEPK